MDKELQRQLSVMAEWMGYKFAGDGKKSHWNITKPGEQEWFFGSWDYEGYVVEFQEIFKYHTSFDALWPVWVKFRDIELSVIGGPSYRDINYAGVHSQWCLQIRAALTESDTPLPAFNLLVEGIEWLGTLK